MLKIEHQPALEPVTVGEVKSLLRLTSSADDADIAGYITAARELGEQISRRSLVYKGYAAYFDCFPAPGRTLEISAPPLVSVTSVKYLDPNFVLQTWNPSEYIVGINNYPGLIQAKYPNIYPVTARVAGNVEVHYYAGYAYGGYGDDAVEIPERARLAIRKLAAHFYDHPESTSAEAQNVIPEGYLSIFKGMKVY